MPSVTPSVSLETIRDSTRREMGAGFWPRPGAHIRGVGQKEIASGLVALRGRHRLIELVLQLGYPLELNLLFLFEYLDPGREVSDLCLERSLTAAAAGRFSRRAVKDFSAAARSGV